MNNDIERDARYAAELDKDATKEKLAEVYASALLGAIKSQNASYDLIWKEYDAFIDLCDAYPKFEQILASVIIPVDEKRRMLNKLADGPSDLFANFLKTLAKRGRFELLREIRVVCRRLDDARKGRVPVKITVAAPIEQSTIANLTESLRQLINGEPEFLVVVDPETIGGIIVRVGDMVYDASIATQLNKVRQDMIDRSAHEIQSRRDCFRNPEGN